jgi:hypothetical protein
MTFGRNKRNSGSSWMPSVKRQDTMSSRESHSRDGFAGVRGPCGSRLGDAKVWRARSNCGQGVATLDCPQEAETPIKRT